MLQKVQLQPQAASRVLAHPLVSPEALRPLGSRRLEEPLDAKVTEGLEAPGWADGLLQKPQTRWVD